MPIGRGTTYVSPGYIFPPFETNQVWKITMTDLNGTVLDITTLISKCTVNDYCTNSIGDFAFEIEDPDATYQSLWVGGETFKYYKDFGTEATTLRFQGTVEKVGKGYHRLIISGRSKSLIFLTRKITASYANTLTSSILTDLINNYGEGFTSTNVEVSSNYLTVNWYDKFLWECVKELCSASGFEAWVDSNLDWHFFESGSRLNDTEGVAHDANLLNIDDFTPDYTQVRNRIIVYGAEVDGNRLFYTAKDLNVVDDSLFKDEVISDDNITDYTQLVAIGDYELSIKKDPPLVGSVKSYLLVGVRPGDSVRIADEDDGFVDGYYPSTGYTDVIDYMAGEYYTQVYLTKETRKVSQIVGDRISNEYKKAGTNSNPYGLENAYVLNFDSESGTHSGTAIGNGVLYPTGSSGTWISPVRSLSGNLNSVYLSLSAENVNYVSVSFSSDNGSSYTSISNGEFLEIAGGASIIIKVDFSIESSSVSSLSLQYSAD